MNSLTKARNWLRILLGEGPGRHKVVSLSYCSQNGGNLYRAPYYNGNPNIGPRIIGNLDQYPNKGVSIRRATHRKPKYTITLIIGTPYNWATAFCKTCIPHSGSWGPGELSELAPHPAKSNKPVIAPLFCPEDQTEPRGTARDVLN